ncbi:unnamed protein product [Dracunculus medinensis]|uniref:non-specific protein-tyrosine kinase n=1 Tax=Dracunculus medinensis TaxID=318479 RepID=A0A0N4UFK0_DRAME|nr:unnamed protein product [Dracunculus medinensis]
MMNDSDIIRVYIPNRSPKNVRFNMKTTVKRIISTVLTALDIDKVSFNNYALRLVESTNNQLISDESYWLHNDYNMNIIKLLYFNNTINSKKFRFELRLRFIPMNLQEMYQTQMDSFEFLYHQVFADYLMQISWKLPNETVLELAALELRRKYGSISQCSVEKCINYDELEANGELSRLVPESVIIKLKPKYLRKTLISGVKKNLSLSPTECMFRFMEIILKVTQFDVEIFKASLGAGWSSPVDLIVGMKMNISYDTADRCTPSLLTKLQYIVDINVTRLNENSEAAVVNLKLTGTPEPFSSFALCPKANTEVFENILISDEYNFLNGLLQTIPGQEMRINRSNVILEQLLGDGQFGNVYRGSYTKNDGSILSVAVKVCKIDSEPSEMQGFLEEALVMNRFHHPHIVKLIGACMELPIWIIMELASYGELRQYLIKNSVLVDFSIQLTFSAQLSSAILYLHSCNYVHRDIAIRNVLVSTPHCIKLSDFGLSRCLDQESFYTSTKGKLPIKWMAPESICYRRFNKATDVWMLGNRLLNEGNSLLSISEFRNIPGVCIWEILMFGMKPWKNIRNHDVFGCLENNERLLMPDNCPQPLYNLLLSMWSFDAEKRPVVLEVNHFLNYLLEQIDLRVPYDQLKAPLEKVFIGKSANNVGDDNHFNNFKNFNSLDIPHVLKVDSSLIPTSMLWRTLEQQRIQSEQDGRWLEEEEKMFPQLTTSLARTSDELNLSENQVLLSESGKLPYGFEFDRSCDTIHQAVLKVVTAVSNLSKSYSPNIAMDRFVYLVKNITKELENLFAESCQCKKKLQRLDQRQVQLVETLLGSDMGNLTRTMKKALNSSNTRVIISEDYILAFREVLKISHRLALNSKHFLDSVDSARLRNQIAHLKKKEI